MHHTSPDVYCQAQVDTDAPSAAGYEHSLRLVLSVVQQVWILQSMRCWCPLLLLRLGRSLSFRLRFERKVP
jgi:hypothetical protein